MSNFVPKKQHLREVILHYFLLKKSAAETHRLLVEAYGEHAPSNTTCKEWFQRFKGGDFDVADKERGGRPKKVEDAELEALLEEDPQQTENELAEQLNVTQACFERKTSRNTWKDTTKLLCNTCCTCNILLKSFKSTWKR